MFSQFSTTALRRVAMAAVVCAAATPSAFAATKVVNDGYITYAPTTAPLLAALGVSVKPTGAATSSGGLFTPTVLDFPITKVTMASSTSISSVNFATSGFSMTRGSKSSSVSNLSFDMASKTVYGDVAGGPSHLAILTGSSISGGYVAPGSFSYTVNSMRLTNSAATLFASKLGLPSYVAYLAAIPFGTGAIKAVPEPSTYALLGLGLAGAAAVARRRRAA